MTSPRLKEEPVDVITTRHFSPGIPWRIKKTAPSWRAMKWPPWATFSISVSKISPTAQRADLGDAIDVSLWVYVRTYARSHHGMRSSRIFFSYRT